MDKSVIAGFGWTDISLAKLSNDYNLESANDSKGKLIPLCSVNPIWGKSAVNELRRCYELGAKGLGELHLDVQGIFDNDLNAMNEIMDAPKEDLAASVSNNIFEGCGNELGGTKEELDNYLALLANKIPGKSKGLNLPSVRQREPLIQ